MTNDELEKEIQSVLEQQDRFTLNAEQSDKRMNRLESAFVGLFALVAETAKAQKALTEDVKTLAQVQADFATDFAHIQAETEEQLSKLAQAQSETGERLNVFINVLERYISEGRNGSGKE